MNGKKGNKDGYGKENMFLTTMQRLAKNKLAVVGLIIIILMILTAVFAPVIAPYGYEEQDLYNTLKGPSAEHWFGTDDLGRDIFSRIIYGGRNSLSIGLISVFFSAVIGIALGSASGYYGGKVNIIKILILDFLRPMHPI